MSFTRNQEARSGTLQGAVAAPEGAGKTQERQPGGGALPSPPPRHTEGKPGRVLASPAAFLSGGAAGCGQQARWGWPRVPAGAAHSGWRDAVFHTVPSALVLRVPCRVTGSPSRGRRRLCSFEHVGEAATRLRAAGQPQGQRLSGRGWEIRAAATRAQPWPRPPGCPSSGRPENKLPPKHRRGYF